MKKFAIVNELIVSTIMISKYDIDDFKMVKLGSLYTKTPTLKDFERIIISNENKAWFSCQLDYSIRLLLTKKYSMKDHSYINSIIS